MMAAHCGLWMVVCTDVERCVGQRFEGSTGV